MHWRPLGFTLNSIRMLGALSGQLEENVLMPMTSVYAEVEPARDEIDALEGPAVIEFITPWCEYCSAAQPLLAAALAKYPSIAHVKIEDGKGRPLG